MTAQDRSSTSRSHGFIFGNGADLGSILASLMRGQQDLGEPIATGADDIIAALEAYGESRGAPLPQSAIDQLRQQLKDHPNATLHSDGDGGFVIMTAAVKAGDGLGDFEGFDMANIFGRGRGQRREREPQKPATPIQAFIKTVAGASKTEKKTPGRTMALDISLAALATATDIARYPKIRHSSARDIAGAFAKMVYDSEIADPTKFKNLAGYLGPYGVGLKNVAERARQFADEPHVDVAESLVSDLSRLGAVLVSVMHDAADKADALKADALNI